MRHPVKPDDGQRTLNLMQMRSAKTDLRQVALSSLQTCGVLLKRFVSAPQGKIDLALDPSQRADIKFCRCIHEGQYLRSLRRAISPP